MARAGHVACAPWAFVAFEGIDGGGKSTQAALLVDFLRAAGHEVLLDHEPTDSPPGREVMRAVRGERAFSLGEQVALFTEDRALHLETTLRPAWAAGRIVVLDRYAMSTAAYQARDQDQARALWRDQRARFPMPGATFLLDLAPEIALDRIRRGRGDTPNAFEKLDNLRRVRANFLALTDPTVCLLDGTHGVEALHRQVTDRWRAVVAKEG